MKGTDYSNQERLFLLPWFIAAGGWCLITLILLDEYNRIGDPRYLEELFLLLSLLWAEFGFAAIFNAAYHGRFSHLRPYLVITLLPPLWVYALFFL